MIKTYSDHNKIYSIDMMFAYINIYKPKSKYVNVKSLLKNLEYKGWGVPEKNIRYSPLDVIKSPTKKIYKNQIERIEKANLEYPIILNEDDIVDGFHRLTKAYLINKKKIKAYVFSKTDMEKFLINKTKNWNKVDKLQTYDFIKLFFERFFK